jgi:hypothetical protein
MKLIRWMLGAAVVLGIAVFLVYGYVAGRQTSSKAAERETVLNVGGRVTRSTTGTPVIKLDDDDLAAAGMKTAKLDRTDAPAEVTAAGGPRTGVVLPGSAVIRYGGKTWAYVQLGDDNFARVQAPLDYPMEQGWFLGSKIKAGQRVVVTGAELLLSEELKAEIQVNADDD